MGTLLTTSRMSPELAARVEASVRGRRAAPGARSRTHSVAVLRLAALVAIAAASAGIMTVSRQARERFEQDRAELLARARREAASLDASEKAAPAHVQAWLERCSGQYAGDWIVDELRAPEALDKTLRRSTVYVRGPLASFKNSTGLMEAAASSFKDAFPLCLVDPPSSRTEKSLIAGARGAFVRAPGEAGGGSSSARAPQIERFYHALSALPFLTPAWEQLVRATTEQAELDKLRHAFERMPFERAKRAAKSELLLFAMDEPSDAAGPTELDGERPHHVRVGLVELASAKVLFRLRRRVDPSWLSTGARAEYASTLDSCALAYDVRTDVVASNTSDTKPFGG